MCVRLWAEHTSRGGWVIFIVIESVLFSGGFLG